MHHPKSQRVVLLPHEKITLAKSQLIGENIFLLFPQKYRKVQCFSILSFFWCSMSRDFIESETLLCRRHVDAWALGVVKLGGCVKES